MKVDFLTQAKETASNLLKNATEGNMYYKPNMMLCMDTDDINTAKNIWMFNINGIGHSKTGINGIFGTAITMDGHIVADFIDTGTLTANIIKTRSSQISKL